MAGWLRGGRVRELRLGWGPVVWEGRLGEAELRLALLPLGGRIRIEGIRGRTARAVVAVSGAVANVAVAVVLFALGALALGGGAAGMPGYLGGGPLGYAIEQVGAWLWFVPRLIGSPLGWSAAPAVGLGAIPGLLREGTLGAGLYLAGAIFTLWGVLNLIPLPGLRTDGWLFVEALLGREAS